MKTWEGTRSQTCFSDIEGSTIVTWVRTGVFEKIITNLHTGENRLKLELWDDAILRDPTSPTGIKSSLRRLPALEAKEEGLVCLSWGDTPDSDLIRSFSIFFMLLGHFGDGSDSVIRSSNQLALEVEVGKSGNGWFTCADLDPRLWDLIEVQSIDLKAINAKNRQWLQRTEGKDQYGQYATIFNGRDGPTYQVYQPIGSGLWIVGSRKRDISSWQMTCHNTDTSYEAFMHVLSLCILHSQASQQLGLPI